MVTGLFIPITKISKPGAKPRQKKQKEKPTKVKVTEVADEGLYDQLREVRKQIAESIGKPPYVVFSNATLTDMTAATVFSDGQIAEAKEYIDAAFSSPEVATMAKAWITKGEIYADIYRFNMWEELDVFNPLSEADAAFRKAFELDMASAKKPGKYLERVRTGMYNTAIGHFASGGHPRYQVGNLNGRQRRVFAEVQGRNTGDMWGRHARTANGSSR